MLFAVCTASKFFLVHILMEESIKFINYERAIFSVIATIALAFLLLPMCQYIIRPCSDGNRISFGICGRFTTAELFSFTLSVTVVCIWVLTGHWLLMDAMGIALCVAFIAFVRLPSLKVSTLLLTGLLIYDVFWVFFSSYIFSTNVMVKVATRPAEVSVILWLLMCIANFYIWYTESSRNCREEAESKWNSQGTAKTKSARKVGLSEYAQQRSLFDARSRWYRHARLAAVFRPSIWFVQKVTKYDDNGSWNSTTKVYVRLQINIFPLFLIRVSKTWCIRGTVHNLLNFLKGIFSVCWRQPWAPKCLNRHSQPSCTSFHLHFFLSWRWHIWREISGECGLNRLLI